MSENKKMSVSNSPSFVKSGEKALLAYKGTLFTVTLVEKAESKYGPCWHIHARFEKTPMEKIISLPATQKRNSAMDELAKELAARGPLTHMTLCYRWRAYHLLARKLWRKPPSLDTVLFLR